MGIRIQLAALLMEPNELNSGLPMTSNVLESIVSIVAYDNTCTLQMRTILNILNKTSLPLRLFRVNWNSLTGEVKHHQIRS